jgi:hypothetical protein
VDESTLEKPSGQLVSSGALLRLGPPLRPSAMKKLGNDAGLAYRRHVTPALHNFVMAFDKPS